jgi:acyl-CoA thioesterase FadM
LGITANANHFHWLTVALANMVRQLMLGFAERALNFMLILVRL